MSASRATSSTVPFVAPVRQGRPYALWPNQCTERMDLIWAILAAWNTKQLMAFMTVLHTCVTTLHRDESDDEEEESLVRHLCNTHYWMHHYLPVLLPDPQLLPVTQGFLALRRAAAAATKTQESIDVITASMRLVSLIALTVDYRVRLLCLTDSPKIHGRMGTRPPEQWRFWNFLKQHGGTRAQEYVDNLEHALHYPGEHAESVAIYARDRTHQVLETLYDMWLTGLPPLPMMSE